MELFHRAILKLPPELAHHVGLSFLRLFQWIVFHGLTSRAQKTAKTFDAPVAFDVRGEKRTLANRVGIAAGFDKNAQCFAALSLFGIGFLEVGTVTPLPQRGNDKPRIWRVPPFGIVNRLGFNSAGVEAIKRNIERYRSQVPGLFIFANLGKGKETPLSQAVEDYLLGAATLIQRVDGFVINVSSPNTKGLTSLQDIGFFSKLEEGLQNLFSTHGSLPVFIKLSSDLIEKDLREICEYILQSSLFSGLVLSNTSQELRASLTSYPEGGLSGGPLFEKTQTAVSTAFSIFQGKKKIIGVGGVFSVEDANDLLARGADLVEVYTGFIYQGPLWLWNLTQKTSK